MVDVVNLLSQTKRFIENEKDTVLGLLALIFAEILILNFLSDVFSILKTHLEWIVLGVAFITLIVWWKQRNIPVSREKFTIGLSFIDLLSLGVKEMSSEAKYGIEKELSNFLHQSTATRIRKLNTHDFIEVVSLPKRIKPNFKKAHEITKKLDIQMLVWFETFYEKGNVILEPRFEFLQEPTNSFYKQFKEQLKNFRTFQINISEPLKKESDITYLLYDLVYLGLLFKGLSLSANRQFKEAHKAFDVCFKSMQSIKKQTPILHMLYIAGQFFEARSYHQWANYQLEHRKEKEAIQLLKKAAKILFNRAQNIKKQKGYNKEEYLENSYIYGVALLIKAGATAEARKKLKQVQRLFKRKADYWLLLAEIEKRKNHKKAKQCYMKAVRASGASLAAYEKLARYLFEKQQYKEAIKFFSKRLELTEKRTFQPDLYEEEDHMLLFKAYLKERKLIKANKELQKYLHNHFKNRYLQERYFDLSN